MKFLILLCLGIFGAASASAQRSSSTRMEPAALITQTVTNIFVGSDERDWARVRRSFAPQVLLDYTSLAGGQPAMLTPEQILNAWQGVLPGFEHTHHQLGNFDVQVLNDREATAFCYGTATHYLLQPSGGNLWTVVGTYLFHLVRLGATWQVDQMKFNLKYQDGNLQLPQLAAERVKQTVVAR